MANNLTINEELEDAERRLGGVPERMLGRGHIMPFNSSNSGARKLLASSQADQCVPVKEAQVAIVTTGSENKYGDLSSSIIVAEGDYRVIAIIDKYSFKPKYHYWVIFYDQNNKRYLFQEVVHYKHISEKHGFRYNTTMMDSLDVGDEVKAGTILRKSTSYDEYNNRMDGINTMCLYMGTNRNTEDSVIVNSEIVDDFSTTLYKKFGFAVAHNVRLLNHYGTSDNWKSFPDIDEPVENSIFCSARESNKSEQLYTLSYERLKESFMSDDNTIVSGKVVDIDVMANDTEHLNTFYNTQLKKYWTETQRVAYEFSSIIQDIFAKDPHAEVAEDLKDFVYTQRRILNGDHFMNDGKEYNNCYIRVNVEEDKPLDVGDKLADRYGGKGVVSLILPPELMAMNTRGERVGIVINQSTCVNRENPGQLFEMELTYISGKIITFMIENKLDTMECIDMILKFYSIVSPLQYEYFKNYVDRKLAEGGMEILDELVYSIKQDEYIYLSLRPIQDNMTIDKLAELYDAFPFVDKEDIIVPIVNSVGEVRYVPAMHKAIMSKKYMYRLKQFSEEKFSSTSLSATNIRNLNTKSKAYKKYKSFHSNTPIAMGSMESDDLSSVGQEWVISNLMMNSVSPMGRRLMKQALTGDPFALDIQLDTESTNRNVEILNAYQKTKGVALRFRKIKKVMTNLVQRMRLPRHPQMLINRSAETPENIMKAYNERVQQEMTNDQFLIRRNLVRDNSLDNK